MRPPVLRLTRTLAFLASAAGICAPTRAFAQSIVPQPILPFEATPLGALPPMPLPMPASRDHNYWGFRLQTGERMQRGPEDLFAAAAGIDYQVNGGSIFGLTGGYQWRQHCLAAVDDCGGHALFGTRARFNIVTGGPTFASLWGDHDATSTWGAEIGLGMAPRIAPGVNACTVDVGIPFSISSLERIHLVSFITPGIVREIDCSTENSPVRTGYLVGFGFGIQQLGFRGLDVHLGMQRIFRGTTGVQFGLSVSWVRLP